MNALSVHPDDGLPSDQGNEASRDTGQRLGRKQRLTRSADIREAFDQKHKQVGRFMVLWRRTGDDTSNRLAVVASKKVGGAVRRARARRRLRDVFRRNRSRLTGADDIVLVARAGIVAADAAAVEKEFLELAARAGIYKAT